MTVAGIDFSTLAIDVVLLEDEGWHAEWHRFPIKGKDGSLQACRRLRAVWPGSSWWEDHGVWLAGIEEPYSRFGASLIALGRIQGAVMALLPRSITVVQTGQQEWLRAHTGLQKLPKGTAERKAVAIARGRELGFEASEIDAYDAYGIACAVRDLNEQGVNAAQAASRKEPHVPAQP